MKNEDEDIMRPNLRYSNCCGNCKHSYYSQEFPLDMDEVFCIKGFSYLKEAIKAKEAIIVEQTQICDWYEE